MLKNSINIALLLLLQVLLAIAIHTSADESFNVRQHLSTVSRSLSLPLNLNINTVKEKCDSMYAASILILSYMNLRFKIAGNYSSRGVKWADWADIERIKMDRVNKWRRQ